MKTPDIHDQIGEVTKQTKHLRNRAVEKIRESAGAADRMMHQNTYNVLAAGAVLGFVIGFLVSRGCRRQAP